MCTSVVLFLSFAIASGLCSSADFFLELASTFAGANLRDGFWNKQVEEEEWKVPSLEELLNGPIYFVPVEEDWNGTINKVPGKRIKRIFLGKLDNIRWRTYVEGRKAATKSNKPIFMIFVTEWDNWSEKQELVLHTDKQLQSTITSQFVPIRISAVEERQLTAALRIQAFPTIVLAAPDGKILSYIEGYHEPERLLESLERARNQVTAQK